MSVTYIKELFSIDQYSNLARRTTYVLRLVNFSVLRKERKKKNFNTTYEKIIILFYTTQFPPHLLHNCRLTTRTRYFQQMRMQ